MNTDVRFILAKIIELHKAKSSEYFEEDVCEACTYDLDCYMAYPCPTTQAIQAIYDIVELHKNMKSDCSCSCGCCQFCIYCKEIYPCKTIQIIINQWTKGKTSETNNRI